MRSTSQAVHPQSAHQGMLALLQYNFPSSQGNGDALGEDVARIRFPDITIRPGTHLDTRLSSQPFSRCTVPVVGRGTSCRL